MRLDQDRAKEAAGRRAADLVKDGMRVGLGTGSTVCWTVTALGERKPDVLCVASSERTGKLAEEAGLQLVAPDEASGPAETREWLLHECTELLLAYLTGGAATRGSEPVEFFDVWG